MCKEGAREWNGSYLRFGWFVVMHTLLPKMCSDSSVCDMRALDECKACNFLDVLARELSIWRPRDSAAFGGWAQMVPTRIAVVAEADYTAPQNAYIALKFYPKRLGPSQYLRMEIMRKERVSSNRI